MTQARERLSRAHAQTHPRTGQALAEAQSALAANTAAARRALSDLVSIEDAAALSARSVDVIAESMVKVLEQARDRGAKETLLEAVRGYQRCIHEAAIATSSGDHHTKSQLRACCKRHLGLTRESCLETATAMHDALDALKQGLPSEEAYRHVTRALFSREAATNWAHLFAAAAISIGTLSVGAYKKHKRVGEAKMREERAEQERREHERQLHAAEARAGHESDGETDFRRDVRRAVGAPVAALGSLALVGYLISRREVEVPGHLISRREVEVPGPAGEGRCERCASCLRPSGQKGACYDGAGNPIPWYRMPSVRE